MIPEIYFSNALLCGLVLQATEGFLECISVRVRFVLPFSTADHKRSSCRRGDNEQNQSSQISVFSEQVSEPTCSQCASHDDVVVAVAAKKFDGEANFLAEFALPHPPPPRAGGNKSSTTLLGMWEQLHALDASEVRMSGARVQEVERTRLAS